MRVLSIRQPWATLIVLGIKNVENRTWTTNYRGVVLIHASSTSPNKEDVIAAQNLCKKVGVPFPEDFPKGGVIGSVNLVGTVWCDHNKIKTDINDLYIKDLHGYNKIAYGFVLVEAQRYENIIPMRGRLGLTVPPPEIIQAISKFS